MHTECTGPLSLPQGTLPIYRRLISPERNTTIYIHSVATADPTSRNKSCESDITAS
jgi:hypothetical protein